MPLVLSNTDPPGRKLRHGDRVRAGILDAALGLAAQFGLEGLTMGDLAKSLGMSKSGLFVHFRSKEELQLAVLDAARWRFVAEVIEPARDLDHGLPRLNALVDRWLESTRKRGFRAAAFFEAVALEFVKRPGAVRNRVAALVQAWLDTLQREVDLLHHSDRKQLVFEINAALHEANFQYQMTGDRRALTRGRVAVTRALAACQEPPAETGRARSGLRRSRP